MNTLKIALLIAVTSLVGCVAPVDKDIANARMNADVERTHGDLKWHNGTGIVYTPNRNQCGKNCANHAELAVKMDREKAAREAAGNPEYDRIVAREKEAYRRQAVMNRCSQGISLRAAALQDKAYDAALSYGYDSKQALQANQAFVKFRNQSLPLLNECVKYGLTQK